MNTPNDFDKSRTQLKKEAIALQKIGERLAALSDPQLARMALPTLLTEAIRSLRSMKSHGARRRQMQYIGTLMRSADVAPIQQALLDIEQGAYRQANTFHRVEQWRDRLIAGDDHLVGEILDAFPDADRQRLGQLVRSARKEKKSTNASSRNLFRYLKQLAD